MHTSVFQTIRITVSAFQCFDSVEDFFPSLKLFNNRLSVFHFKFNSFRLIMNVGQLLL